MSKKRKPEIVGVEDLDRSLHLSFIAAANKISHLYTIAQKEQVKAYKAGERHGLVGNSSSRLEILVLKPIFITNLTNFTGKSVKLDINSTKLRVCRCVEAICRGILIHHVYIFIHYLFFLFQWIIVLVC